MKYIPCPRCPHENSYGIVEITEDYITLECPECGWQFAIVAGADQEK